MNLSTRSLYMFTYTRTLYTLRGCMIVCVLFLKLSMYLVHFTTQAQEKNNVGDYAGAKDYGNIALECNICTIVFHVVLVFILAITVPVAVILTRE